MLCDFLSSSLLCTNLPVCYLFVFNESRSDWASHPAGSGDVGAHSWEQFGRYGWRWQVGFSFQADGKEQGGFVPALLKKVNN